MNIEKIQSLNKNGNIWMFHKVRLKDSYISNIYDKRNIVHNFDNIIYLIDEYLKLGYSFGSINEAINDDNVIHLTFDDGYKEFLSKVLNIQIDTICFLDGKHSEKNK